MTSFQISCLDLGPSVHVKCQVFLLFLVVLECMNFSSIYNWCQTFEIVLRNYLLLVWPSHTKSLLFYYFSYLVNLLTNSLILLYSNQITASYRCILRSPTTSKNKDLIGADLHSSLIDIEQLRSKLIVFHSVNFHFNIAPLGKELWFLNKFNSFKGIIKHGSNI